MATRGKSVRKKSSGKTNRKWNQRISGTTSVVNLIFITLSAIIAAATIGFSVSHFFLPAHQPPAQLTAEIEKATVQQNVMWGDYLLETDPTGSVIQNPGSQGSPTHSRIFEKILRHAAVGN
jgi:hypothetical protein